MKRFAMALAGVALAAAPAAAQTAGNFALDGFHPAMDSRGYLTVNSSEVLGDKEISFGLGSLDWGHNLLALDGGGTHYSIDNVISATLVGALGLRLGPAAFELGISAPFSIMSGDAAPSQANTTYRVDGQGLGNIGLHLKTQLLDARRSFVGLGLIASVYLPTTTEQDKFLGDARTTPQLMAVLDKHLGSRVRIALNGGIRLRSSTTFTNSDPGFDMAPVTNQSISVGEELPFGAAIALAVSPEKLDLIGEVFGSMPLGAHTDYQPLEALAGVKLYLAKNSFLSLGAGRGLVADKGGSPDMRAFIGIVFEPRPDQRVHSHLPDDEMPARPEPTPPLADNDKLPDRIPLCAEEPEAEGCLPLDTVIDTGAELVLLNPINFEFDKAIITKDSYSILDDVVTAFGNHPDIGLVEVRGHTDERGNAAYNLDLSQRRAAAVVEYLTTHGLAADHLRSKGFGMTMPIDPAHNERAWEKNRRVEFSILKRSGS